MIMAFFMHLKYEKFSLVLLLVHGDLIFASAMMFIFFSRRRSGLLQIGRIRIGRIGTLYPSPARGFLPGVYWRRLPIGSRIGFRRKEDRQPLAGLG